MKTIIIGAGGHSRVVYDILSYDQNTEVVAFIDNTPRGSEETIMGVPVKGDHEVIRDMIEKEGIGGFIIAVGDNKIRRNHFEKLIDMGLEPVSAIHPESYVSKTATIGAGTVIASGANVSTNAEIGKNSILNTGAIVDHEATIGPHVHIAPGTTIAGRVEIDEFSFVGMGSTVGDYTNIGKNVTVGAGSAVLEDVPPDVTIAGSPAEIKRQKETDN